MPVYGDGYVLAVTRKLMGQPMGLAPLDSSGCVPAEHMPAGAQVSPAVVAAATTQAQAAATVAQLKTALLTLLAGM
jgi:hypothetical protein